MVQTSPASSTCSGTASSTPGSRTRWFLDHGHAQSGRRDSSSSHVATHEVHVRRDVSGCTSTSTTTYAALLLRHVRAASRPTNAGLIPLSEYARDARRQDGIRATTTVRLACPSGSMPTSASSAPGTPGSPRRAGCSQAGSRSSCSRRATASAAGSGPHHLADGTPVDRGGAWLGAEARRHLRARGARSASPTYKTWVKGAHLLVGDGRTRRYTGLIPKISPLAVVTHRAGAVQDRPDGQAASRSTRRGRRSARRGVGRALGGVVARALRDPHRDRARPVRDGGAGAVHRRPGRRLVPPPAVPRARATAASTRCSRSRAARRRTWSTAAPGRSRSGSPTSSAMRCA